MRGTTAARGNSSCTTRANAARGSATRISVRPIGKSSVTSRQPARDWAAIAAAFRFPTNAMSLTPADSSGATPVISRSPCPSQTACNWPAISSTRNIPVSYKLMPIDPSAIVAATARVHPKAQISAYAVIGEFAIIEADVSIGPFCRLEPYVYVKRWTTLGKRNEISAGTVLGTDPLDKGFTGERSYLRIGNGNIIREHYTISRGTQPESATEIGDSNYIMTSGHIAHNCKIGNNCVIASCALVAGHVEVEDQAFISGGVVIHQFSKIGRLAMIGGNSRVNSDVPPFFLYSDFNVAAKGLHLVGLRRAGFAQEEIAALKLAYKILYRSGLKQEDALARIESELKTEHTRHLVKFIRCSKRSICRP